MFTKRNWAAVEQLETEIEAASLVGLTNDRAQELVDQLNDLVNLLGPRPDSLFDPQQDSDKLESLVRAHRVFEAHSLKHR